jgi:hypothetical protein
LLPALENLLTGFNLLKTRRRWRSNTFLVLVFAIVSIFAQVNPNLSALIAFLGVLAAECVRWRSDAWKSEGESAKRKWEVTDGLGVAVDGSYIADWLAAKSKGFLADVSADEIQGSEFDSVQQVGARRVVENTLETARNSAPLLPTFVWKFHGKHLREQWVHFHPQRTGL